MIKDSYKDLLTRVDMLNANKNDVINYFIHNYGYGSRQAEYAAILFYTYVRLMACPCLKR